MIEGHEQFALSADTYVTIPRRGYRDTRAFFIPVLVVSTVTRSPRGYPVCVYVRGPSGFVAFGIEPNFQNSAESRPRFAAV